MNRIKIFCFGIASVLIGTIAALVVLEAIFRQLPVQDSLMTLPVDAENPLVRFKENRDVVWSRGADFSIVARKHVNNYGFLNDQDYFPEKKLPLMAVIGDSFVEAPQVRNSETMHGLLSKRTGDRARIYSFGASGSPLSTYLVYAEYADRVFHADALVFVVVGNDFDESLIRYNKRPGFHYFTEADGRMKLVRIDYRPTGLKRMLRESALVRYLVLNLQFNRNWFGNALRGSKDWKYVGQTEAAFDEERMRDSRKVVRAFFEELPKRTVVGRDKILFVVDGVRPHLYDPEKMAKAREAYAFLIKRYFIDTARELGYEAIDMQPVFVEGHKAIGQRFEFPTDAHWNEAGHKLVADQIESSAVYGSLMEAGPKETGLKAK